MDNATPADIWRRGDYGIVGDWFQSASRSVLDTEAGPLLLDGRTVLDVAAGTGTVAIEAARQGATVVAYDITPELLTIAAERARTAGVDIETAHGSFDTMRGLGTFDVVVSSFGAMMAPDPRRVAGEMAAVCNDQGTIGITAWHPEGAFGGPPESMNDILGEPGIEIGRWADPVAVQSFFAPTGFAVTRHRREVVHIPFPSPTAAVDELRRLSGPWIVAFEHASANDLAEVAVERLAAHLQEHSEAQADGIALRCDYTVTHLERT